MNGYTVTWSIDIEEATSFEDAARRAYNSFCRPGSIAHVFEVTDGATSATVDLDRGADTEAEGWPISYPLGEVDGDHRLNVVVVGDPISGIAIYGPYLLGDITGYQDNWRTDTWWVAPLRQVSPSGELVTEEHPHDTGYYEEN